MSIRGEEQTLDLLRLIADRLGVLTKGAPQPKCGRKFLVYDDKTQESNVAGPCVLPLGHREFEHKHKEPTNDAVSS